MTEEKAWYEKYKKVSAVVYEILCFICVLCLGIELFSVFVMVCGRYIFNNVPTWCDQLSYMALVWMSIISIALGLYNADHMRVEIFDRIFPEKLITVLKYLSNIIIIIFSVLMIKYGMILIELTKKVILSGFRVSTSLMYWPLVICGISSIYISVFCMVRRYMEGENQ